MMGKWREVRLGEIAEIYDGPHATPKKTDNGPIFLGISNISRGLLDLSNTEHVSENDFHRWTRRVEPEEGDVVFSYETRLGEAARVPHGLRCCLGRRMGLLRARGGLVDPRFLLYAYLGPDFQDTLYSRTVHGSTVDRIPLINMPHFPIVIPGNIQEQRRIAHVLGTLDDKIENNRKTAKTLEALAQAIFKSWFVDFDPVRAKMAGESRESICKRLKLTPEILDLFPDRLVDSELGEIPEGWLTTTLGSITSRIKRGLSPAYSDGYGVLVLNQKCIREFMVDTSKARRHDPAVRSIEGLLLEVGDVLVNSTGVGTLGRVAQVLHIQESSIIDSHVTLVRPNKKYPWSYLGQLVKTLQPQIEEMGEGSTGQTELSRGKLANLLITLPTTSILEKYHKIILPVKGRISDCEWQIQILKNIRDTLLPKLISGEIRVSHGEVIVEEAL